MFPAIGDVRPSTGDDSLAALLCAASDELYVELNTLFSGSASLILLGDKSYPGEAPQQLQVVPFEADYIADEAVFTAPAPVTGDRQGFL